MVRAVWMFVAKIGILSQRHLHRQQGIAHAGDAAARIGVNLFEGLAKQTLARRDSGHVPKPPNPPRRGSSARGPNSCLP